MAASPPVSTLVIRGPLDPADLPGLLVRARALMGESHVAVLGCEVSQLDADAVAVDALARIALLARRAGCSVRVRGASAELLGLIAFAGLSEVIGE
jgi:ABC-type transporter Mla MlaB component